MASGANVKGLEGKGSGDGEEEEEGSIKPREFFWDSITVYVVFAIIGLTTIDLVTEYIKQPEVQCFSRNNQSLLSEQFQDYVNEFCTSALPNTESFTTITYVLGFLVAAPHYLWLNSFGGRFAFFFQLASTIERQRNEETGEYPKKNLIIADQLEDAFTVYNLKRNSIFQVYFAKLVLQLLVSVAGLLVVAMIFTDFNTSFTCPSTLTEAQDATGAWPLMGERVTCVFTSLRLLELIRIADLILLSVIILTLTGSLIWCTASHSNELGYKKVAVFVFQTGLSSRYFVADFKVPSCSRFLQKLYLLFTCIPWFPLEGPRICTDLDFMMMRLFRTDGGLGHVLKEVLILKEVKILNDRDRRRYLLHRNEQKLSLFKTGDLTEEEDSKADLRWIFQKNDAKGVYVHDNYGEYPSELVLPHTIRGAVIGFASRVKPRAVALCISFGSPSLGFVNALGRVFSIVGHINFNPYYYNPDKVVDRQYDSDGITSLTCAEDVLTKETSRDEFLAVAKEIWKNSREEKINFILVSPMDNSFHKSTLNFMLSKIKSALGDNARLLTIHPHKVAGRYVNETGMVFHQYTPVSSLFTAVPKEDAQIVKNKRFVWPKFKPEDDNENGLDREVGTTENLPVYVHDVIEKYKVRAKMSFRMFTRTTSKETSEKESEAAPSKDAEVKVKQPQEQKLLPKVSNVPQEEAQQKPSVSVVIEDQ